MVTEMITIHKEKLNTINWSKHASQKKKFVSLIIIKLIKVLFLYYLINVEKHSNQQKKKLISLLNLKIQI